MTALTPAQQALVDAYNAGWVACLNGAPYESNPYTAPVPATDLAYTRTCDIANAHDAWARGYGTALGEYESETARLDNAGY